MLLFIITPEHESAKLLQCFNTSHVVIYPIAANSAITLSCGFNTSHVVIYQIILEIIQPLYGFQYISCCYLSQLDLNQAQVCGRFNTSHVVIYRKRKKIRKATVAFLRKYRRKPFFYRTMQSWTSSINTSCQRSH